MEPRRPRRGSHDLRSEVAAAPNFSALDEADYPWFTSLGFTYRTAVAIFSTESLLIRLTILPVAVSITQKLQ